MTTAAQLTGPLAHHGEGPIWDVVAGRLLMVDLFVGDVLGLDPLADPDRYTRRHVAPVAAALRPRAGGGFVVATERGFTLTSADLQRFEALPDAFDDPLVRMNDGGCDPSGRFYCGTMAHDGSAGAGSLFRLDADRRVSVVLTDVTISNGLAWSPDGRLAYYVDTAEQRIDVFDVGRDGELTDRRPFVHVDPTAGNPDGLTVDADGGVWVALWDGYAVHGYSPAGELVDRVELPTSRPTACTFGGPELRDLYVTTSRHGLAAPGPADGAVFVARPGPQGRAPLTFAG